MPPLQAFAYVLAAFVWNVAAQDPTAHAATPVVRMRLHDWQCGATAAERILAYDSARSVCGDYMHETNDCCLTHDGCYDSLNSTKNSCDDAFCTCLNTMTDQARNGRSIKQTLGCTALSQSFCELVRDYGQEPYDAAQKAARQKAGKKL